MASGTKVYNKDGELIFPITSAEAVFSNALTTGGNVEDCLLDLYKKIGELTGDEEAVSSIKVEIGYKQTATKDEAEVKEITSGWGAFKMPTTELPYTWKKTVFTYAGKEESELNTVYEIVAAYPDLTHTIYRATDGTIQPTISYDLNDEGKPDYQNVDYVTLGWSDIPVSLSALAPFVYMASRTRVDGLWGPFSVPVLYGRWAYDSLLEIRYKVTNTVEAPEINKTITNPDGWVTEITGEYSGYLWIITASSVNGLLNIDASGDIWRGPNLISKM